MLFFNLLQPSAYISVWGKREHAPPPPPPSHVFHVYLHVMMMKNNRLVAWWVFTLALVVQHGRQRKYDFHLSVSCDLK